MSINPDFVHGIVLYTITDDNLRNDLREFICQHENLKGNPINESSFSIRRSGDTTGKDALVQFCKNKKFGTEDFVRVYYSAALVHSDNLNTDQIIVLHIVEKGKIV